VEGSRGSFGGSDELVLNKSEGSAAEGGA